MPQKRDDPQWWLDNTVWLDLLTPALREDSRKAERAAELYQEEAKWQEKRENGLRTMRSIYCHRANAAGLIAELEELSIQRDIARSENFVGAMLWHHFHKSTKYFSKWIEAKNQK